MKNRILSSQSDPRIVATLANVANVITPIMVVTTPEGAIYDIENSTVVRGALIRGVAIVADIRNSDGDRIRAGSLLIGSQSPADEFPTFHRSIPLTTWADLTTSEQKNENFRAKIAGDCDLNIGDILRLAKGYQLVVSLQSPEVVDWSNGNSFLELPAKESNR